MNISSKAGINSACDSSTSNARTASSRLHRMGNNDVIVCQADDDERLREVTISDSTTNSSILRIGTMQDIPGISSTIMLEASTLSSIQQHVQKEDLRNLSSQNDDRAIYACNGRKDELKDHELSNISKNAKNTFHSEKTDDKECSDDIPIQTKQQPTICLDDDMSIESPVQLKEVDLVLSTSTLGTFFNSSGGTGIHSEDLFGLSISGGHGSSSSNLLNISRPHAGFDLSTIRTSASELNTTTTTTVQQQQHSNLPTDEEQLGRMQASISLCDVLDSSIEDKHNKSDSISLFDESSERLEVFQQQQIDNTKPVDKPNPIDLMNELLAKTSPLSETSLINEASVTPASHQTKYLNLLNLPPQNHATTGAQDQNINLFLNSYDNSNKLDINKMKAKVGEMQTAFILEPRLKKLIELSHIEQERSRRRLTESKTRLMSKIVLLEERIKSWSGCGTTVQLPSLEDHFNQYRGVGMTSSDETHDEQTGTLDSHQKSIPMDEESHDQTHMQSTPTFDDEMLKLREKDESTPTESSQTLMYLCHVEIDSPVKQRKAFYAKTSESRNTSFCEGSGLEIDQFSVAIEKPWSTDTQNATPSTPKDRHTDMDSEYKRLATLIKSPAFAMMGESARSIVIDQLFQVPISPGKEDGSSCHNDATSSSSVFDSSGIGFRPDRIVGGLDGMLDCSRDIVDHVSDEDDTESDDGSYDEAGPDMVMMQPLATEATGLSKFMSRRMSASTSSLNDESSCNTSVYTTRDDDPFGSSQSRLAYHSVKEVPISSSCVHKVTLQDDDEITDKGGSAFSNNAKTYDETVGESKAQNVESVSIETQHDASNTIFDSSSKYMNNFNESNLISPEKEQECGANHHNDNSVLEPDEDMYECNISNAISLNLSSSDMTHGCVSNQDCNAGNSNNDQTQIEQTVINNNRSGVFNWFPNGRKKNLNSAKSLLQIGSPRRMSSRKLS